GEVCVSLCARPSSPTRRSSDLPGDGVVAAPVELRAEITEGDTGEPQGPDQRGVEAQPAEVAGKVPAHRRALLQQPGDHQLTEKAEAKEGRHPGLAVKAVDIPDPAQHQAV